jgi:hypothetical protein
VRVELQVVGLVQQEAEEARPVREVGPQLLRGPPGERGLLEVQHVLEAGAVAGIERGRQRLVTAAEVQVEESTELLPALTASSCRR